MNRIIIFIFFCCCSNLISQNKKSNIIMDVEIDKLYPYQFITINIISPNNLNVWEYKSVSDSICEAKKKIYPSAADSISRAIKIHDLWSIDSYKERNKNKENGKTIKIAANNWFEKEGIYKLSVHIQYVDTLLAKDEVLEFEMDGQEKNVEATFIITNYKDKINAHLSDIYIRKFYKASDSVSLEAKWIPDSNGMPEYIIINNSNRTINGTVLGGDFWGWVEKFNNGKWEYYNRGGFCGTGVPFVSIPPGKTDLSYEGYFIGDVKQFTKGKYKYCVYYSTDKVSMGYAILDNEEVDKKIWNYFLLEKEFEIK